MTKFECKTTASDYECDLASTIIDKNLTSVSLALSYVSVSFLSYFIFFLVKDRFSCFNVTVIT